jgi:NAD(P)-dependent dehydrogenase (short-subunit alcohol dehydrogenase family)
VVELIQLAVPYLEKTKGCVVNVSSINSQKPSSRTASYCSLKAALDMHTRCYADLLGPKGIRVNTVK